MEKIKENLNTALLINAFFLVLIFYSVYHLRDIFSLLKDLAGGISEASAPLFYGLVIAYAVSPLVGFIDRNIMSHIFFTKEYPPLKKEKAESKRRMLDIAAAFILMIAGISCIVYALSVLILNTTEIGGIVPGLASIKDYFYDIRGSALDYAGSLPGGIRDHAVNAVDLLFSYITRGSDSAFIVRAATMLGNVAVNTGIGCVISIYLLKDSEFFKRLWRKFLHLTLSQKSNAVLTGILYDIDSVLSSFIKGAAVDAVAVALLSSAALSFYGVPFSVFTGCFAGIANIIPYFGPVIGMVPAFMSGFFVKGLSGGIVCILILFAVQQIDCNFIYPRVVGKNTGLHPLSVLLSVSIAGHYMGIAGMLIAVPLAGAVKVIFMHLLPDE